MSNYIPIRIKSDHSILKGFGQVGEYIERAKELKLPGLGFAERSTGSSIYKFLSAGKDNDLKVMPGVEFYIRYSEEQPIDKYLITLYAKNNNGLKNLYKLMITSFNNKEDYRDLTPYITLSQLHHLKEDLYILTGYKGTYTYENPKGLLNLKRLFGNNLYTAIERSDDRITEDAKRLNVKIIPATQTLFAYEKHKSSCDIHLAVGARARMSETSTTYGGFRPESRLEDSMLVESRNTGAHFVNKELVLNDLDINTYKEYYDNLSEMIDSVDIKLEFDTHLRPAAVIPEGVDKEQYLRNLVQEGFDKIRRGTKFEEESKKRIEIELDTILGNDYIDYFIVVADYCQFAKKEAGGIGAGRGCFLPGNKVTTRAGKKVNIEDIRINQKVLSHDTKLHKVKNLFEYDVEEECIEIELSNGETITCTKDHEIFRKEDGFTQAQDLKKGDILLGAKRNSEIAGTVNCVGCGLAREFNVKGARSLFKPSYFKEPGEYICNECRNKNNHKHPVIVETLKKNAREQGNNKEYSEKMSQSLKKHWAENYEDRIEKFHEWVYSDSSLGWRESLREANYRRFSDPKEVEKVTRHGGKYKTGYFRSSRWGERKIWYNSSYEQKAMNILETNSEVAFFERFNNSIPYTNELGHKANYVPDFFVVTKSGEKIILEVKAEWQTHEDEFARKTRGANKFIQKNKEDYDKFVVWTEKELFENNDLLHHEVTVEKIRLFNYKGKVYDIEVEDVHNYTIGGVTVHNSAGGSEVAYLLGIHDTDPLQHDLLFERFLSVGRSSEYTITMEDGQDVKHLISDKHQVDGKTLYTHQLEPGMKTEEGVVKETRLTRPTASAVDIDTDFHTQGRAKVLDYTKEKYGKYNVSNVITFMTYGAFSSIKAVCSVLGVPYYKANTISKVLPSDIELSDLVNPSNEANKQLREQFIKWCMQFGSKLAKEIFKHSIRLQGRIKSEGTHACAILIAPTELYNVIPMQFSESDGAFLSQWEYSDCEAIGLVKMDFLNLVTVDLIDTTIQNVNENYPNLYLNKYKIMEDLNDKETLEVFANANTPAIFQFSSDGVKDFLQELKPDSFEDLYAVTALYRPGPMGMGAHKSFTRRKEGKEPRIPFSNEKLIGTTVDKVLATTYGLIPFQESLMAVARTCAGFTPLETDLLRKATGKKIASLLDTLRPKFKEEFKKNINKEIKELGRTEKELLTDKDMDEIWKSLEDFASYSFNKSHSVSYSINAYVAAYLKAHYPNEFMAAAIRQRSGSKDKIEEFIREARDMGLLISNPDINSSAEYTRASKDKIILGMDIISGVGNHAVKEIIKEREKNGLFTSIADCVQRLSKMNSFGKKVMEGLAGAGALDSLNVSRKSVIEHFSKIKGYVDKLNNGKMPLTSGLFATMDMPTDVLLLPDDEYSYLEKLIQEQKFTGFFVSGHPLDRIGEYDLDGVGYKLTTDKMLSKRFKPKSYKTVEGNEFEAWTYPFLVYVLKTERYNLKNGRTVSKITLDTGAEVITTFADKSRENESTIQSMTGKEIVKGNIYVADLSMSNRYSLFVSIVDIKEVELDHNGRFVRVNELNS